ncbi:Protein mraZ [Metamycoplasma cloacale]|uniref:Transcriptional regulator MraZ n=1 Tax=Metamycoplasma cloacale TaxID=92401 RepID=A0A2Z4LMV0_9BACT|nr:division/cell wall cluster transcriptional repressor MraZ [Metamycoplasma cloacale]AWX42748.1 transcriptional regulator MraZ [Metamycoplasma cloacale]VEU79437.1 Protein mraZ [Metamycoplasma cloacale]
MFGKYYKQIDDKNRLVIPAKLLKELGEVMYITLGFDKSIVLRTEKEFLKLKEKLEENNSLNPDFRNLSRYIFGNTEEVQPDSKGRIVLPKYFVDKTTITKEVVFIGVGSYAEIFAKETYDLKEQFFEDEQNIEDLTKKLLEQGVKL